MPRMILPLLFLSAGPLFAQDSALRLATTPNSVQFFAGKQLITEYVHAGTVQVEKGDGQKPLAKPYFYPLNAPNGTTVTRGWPMVRGQAGETTDHFHQKSVWFCHGDVIPEGMPLKLRSGDKRVEGVDFWSETTNHGRIVCHAVSEVKGLPGGAVGLLTKNAWKAPDDTTIMTELRKIKLEKVGPGYLLSFDITLVASECPIVFGDTKEGAMGLRVHDAIRAQQKGSMTGTLVNSAGKKTEKEVWGFEAEWCDYFGTIEGKTVGVALLAHPQNQYSSAWHARGYGLLAANPFGRKASGFPSRKDQTELVKIAKGKSLNLKFAIYTHDGDTEAGQVTAAYKHFTK